MKLINLRQYLEERYKTLLLKQQEGYSLLIQAEMNATMALLGAARTILTKLMTIKVLLLYPLNAIGRRTNEQATIKEIANEVESET